MPKQPNLVYSVETDKPVYDLDETVQISFHVRNKGDADAVIEFCSGEQFDVIIKDEDREKIWQLSSHMSYTQAETSITISPGEIKTFEAQWDQKDDNGDPVALGSYTIQAFLTAKKKTYQRIVTTHIGIRNLPTFADCQELKEKLEELWKLKKPPSKKPSKSSKPWIPRQPSIFYPMGGLYSYAPSMTFYSSIPLIGMSYSSSTYSSGSSKPDTSGGSGGSTTDYSTTNTQVAGVDEADVVKNDGAYIYKIKEKKVLIVRAIPANNLQKASEIEFENEKFTPNQLYVDTDILVVIGKEKRDRPFYYPKWYGFGCCKIFCWPWGTFTRVYIYDITDREDPLLVRTVKFEAGYLQSRRVDDTLYIVMNADPPYHLLDKDVTDPSALLPVYSDSSIHSEDEAEAVVDCDEIAYFPGYTEPKYLVVVAIPIEDPAKEISAELVLGDCDHVYCSTENLYVANTTLQKEPFPLPSRRNPHIFIRSVFWNCKRTVLYKFSLNGESIDYLCKANVPGTLHNQFSMDEYGDFFRVATTSQSYPSNNLYVLDDTLRLAGALEGFAKRETIRSVLFMGERAYIVTFRVIDPFFAISLSEPTHPEILGELKIPGYTEYLHPYDSNHIIGFGRVVENNRELGMKIALFDVTEITDPDVLAEEVIGYKGTYSEVLDDHKAFLFSKARNLMAFPILVTESTGCCKYSYEYVFQGAYFYLINETGFVKDGEATHYDPGTFPTHYLCPKADSILRIIYIGNKFYTISDSMIKAIAMGTYDEIGELILE